MGSTDGSSVGEGGFDVFLSYSRHDVAAVKKLAERLTTDGLRVWFDGGIIEPGDHILLSIKKGLKNSRFIVFVMSRHSIGAKWAEFEVGSVIFNDPTNENKRFIPIRLDNSIIPDDLKPFLSIDYRNEDETEYKKILKACRRDTSSAQDDGKHDQPQTQSSEREQSDRSTDKLLKRLKREISDTLKVSSESMAALKVGMDKLKPEESAGRELPFSAQLTERLVNLDFEVGKDILLQIHEQFIDEDKISDARVIEKVSRKLIPWLYVANSSNSTFIDEKWGKSNQLGDIITLPAGTSSFAAIIMAGLDRRETKWDHPDRDFPGPKDSALENLLAQPENGLSDSIKKSLSADLSKRIQSPNQNQSDEKLATQSIRLQLRHYFAKKGIRVCYVCNVWPDNPSDLKACNDRLQWLSSEFPELAVVKLDAKFLLLDQELFNEIRDLLVTEDV